MPLKADETKLVNIDKQKLAVTELPDEAQQMLKFYDHWKQQELEARSELLKCQNAMQNLANQVASIVKKAEAEAVAKAKAEEASKQPTTAEKPMAEAEKAQQSTEENGGNEL